MSRRKTIALITNIPEKTHGRHICEGVFKQCEKYGFNVAVFASMTEFNFYFKDIAVGEMNIYRLINLKKFDGIIFDNVAITENTNGELAESLCREASELTDIPSVCIGNPLCGLPSVENSNDWVLRMICRHIVEVHGCRKVCLLTGTKGNHESEERLRIYIDELSKHGIETPEEYIIYGDFWYNSGEKLAEDIVAGKISRPDAILSASDHMALGAIQRFTKLGVRVPEDIIVAGFDTTEQGLLNPISATSVESNFAECAANAVDYLAKRIDPEIEIRPFRNDPEKMMHIGKSCGCQFSLDSTINVINALIYRTEHNYHNSELNNIVDIGLLMENYVFERLTGSQTPEHCIENIFQTTYVLVPFVNFYLCLRDNWLDGDTDMYKGFPEQMKLVMSRSGQGDDGFSQENQSILFNTADMLPGLFEDKGKPYAFYFSSVHFESNTFGYAVLQRELSDYKKFDIVYRNWLRFICNALEMARAKHRFAELSVHDKMTGLYNRRGMTLRFDKLRQKAKETDRLCVCVIDMDGLKFINDTFGHSEGDHGIIKVGEAAKAITGENEICVRAGGDEFFIIGVGEYDDFDAEQAIKDFNNKLESLAAADPRPYPILASIGYALGEIGRVGDNGELERVLSEADASMYRYKQMRKRGRF